MDKNQHLDKLFKSAREQALVHSFDDTKASFLNSLNSGLTSTVKGKNGLFTFKNLIIMLTTASTILISAILLINPNDNKNPKNSEISELKPIQQTKESIALLDNSTEINIIPGSQKPNKIKPGESLLPIIIEENFSNPFLTPPPIVEYIFKKVEDQILPEGDPYIIPKLTEDEIKANNKQKKAMLKALEKFDKKVWAYIPTGTFEFKGKTTSVQSFYMEKTEVSNLEYRTFLFDLLIQGRKDEFLKARPDYKQWSILQERENSPYEQHYFSHPVYDDYPVVNVSREGAELYCIWLTQELIKMVDEKKKNQYNDMRIPFREEWTMAASDGGKTKPYTWEGPSMRNSAGNYLANFKRTAEELETLTTEPTDITAPVNSYFPNLYGLYNMCGNVAEMVYDNYSSKLPGTAGGSWYNTAEEIKIEAPDTFDGVTEGNPKIGFRVVMTVLKK